VSALELTADDRRILTAARTATLATIDPAGRPRLVPVCFVVDHGAVLWIPLDDKPKRGADPRTLARVRDILERPGVTVLVDRWSEDWAELAWLRLRGRARLAEPGTAPVAIIDDLRVKYPQYLDHDLESRPAIAVDLEHAVRWSAGPDTR